MFVMLRDEAATGGRGGSVNGTRYFYATNDTTKELPTAGGSGAVSFYQALLAVYAKDAALLSGMQVRPVLQLRKLPPEWRWPSVV